MRAFVILALIVMQVVIASSAMAQGRYILSANASPESILADGRSYSQIEITVEEPGGTPAPDGTEVRLATTAGAITAAAYTYAGRATGILTSSSSPEIAIVTASLGGESTSTQVEFTSSEDVALGSRVIRMQAGMLAYSVEQDMILGSDGVTIEYRDLTISASNAQVCEPLGVIKAQGNVSIARGDESVETDALVYDLRTDRFRAVTPDETPTAETYKAGELRPSNTSAAKAANPLDFAPLSAEGTKTWVISKKLVLFPSEKIQFFKASIYVGDTHIVTLPHYFYDYRNRGSLLNQVRYSSYEGLVLDMPMYYRVTDSGSGAFKLRYAAKGSGYSSYFQPRKGMSLALEQAYSTGDRSDGRFFVDSLSDKERSFELAHHLEYGTSGRMDFSARFQPNSEYAKGVYTASVNAFGSLGKYDYYVTGYMGGSKVPRWTPLGLEDTEYESQTYGSVRASFRSRQPSYIAKGISLSPSLTVGYGHLRDESGRPSGERLYQTLGLNLRSASIGSRKMGLTFDAATELSMAADGRTGTNLRIGPNIRRSWQNGSISLNYTYSRQSGFTSGLYSMSKHNLGGTLFLGSGSKWNCYTYFGYGLDTGRLNMYSSAAYQINNQYRVRMNYSLYRYVYQANGHKFSFDSSYLKAGIYRPIGPYEIGLAWSPDGQQYGMKSDKKLWFEVGTSGF